MEAYQGIAIVTHKNEGVDRRGVIGYADAGLGPVLGVVIGNDRGQGAR